MAHTTVKSAPDCLRLNVNVETLVGNTNKEIAIPEGAMGFHVVYGTLATTSLIYFKLNGAASIPNGTAYVACGVISSTENIRALFEAAAPAGAFTLNLISATGGTIIVEFWG